jgi:hypothetical protein
MVHDNNEWSFQISKEYGDTLRKSPLPKQDPNGANAVNYELVLEIVSDCCCCYLTTACSNTMSTVITY